MGIYKVIISSFNVFENDILLLKDLSAISDYLKEFKKNGTYAKMRKILQKSSELDLRTEECERGIEDFFRIEAEKLMCQEVK